MVAGRAAEVWARLARVDDPELDEPVTELGFVTGVEVSAEGDVRIGFRLPTYWCAANFAFLMADDMRAAVRALPWVGEIRVELGEHMYAETINRGVAEGRSFRQAFGGEADDDLDEVRRTFAVKAFQRRQAALLQHLLAAGHPPALLAALRLGELAALAADPETEALAARYRARRSVAGPAEDDDPAFVDGHGQAVAAEAMRSHLRSLMRVAVNTEFNGALCRGLLAARFGEEPEPAIPGEPTLLDFVRDARRKPAGE